MKTVVLEEEIIISEFTSLYFFSTWFPFHKKMLTMIDKVEKKYEKVNFLAIDVDEFKNSCIRFDIKSVPTVIIYKNRIECDRIIGIPMTSAFLSCYNQNFTEKKK